jgi:pimeloyl-ACP methyl ester carboxylesterase
MVKASIRSHQPERFVMLPETRYARSGDVHIAYQVIGNGPFDLVFVPGFISHVDHVWDEPRWSGFLERLASFSRLICFDKRGTGLSDRVAAIPTLEERMDDARAVMDAVGSKRAHSSAFPRAVRCPYCSLPHILTAPLL